MAGRRGRFPSPRAATHVRRTGVRFAAARRTSRGRDPTVTVAVVARDLIIATRILDAAAARGLDAIRVDAPDGLPPASSASIALVDWSLREAHWGDQLRAWRASAPDGPGPRVILFGPHTDLPAHADARVAGLGPMVARSRLITGLPELLDADH